MSNKLSTASPSESPRRLDRLRSRIRVKHYSLRTETAYLGWVRRYILFHGKRHPAEMGKAEVLEIELPWLNDLVRTKKPARLPTVLTQPETQALLEGGYDIRTVQELLGHSDVSTPMIYTHVLNKGGRGVVSPLDRSGA